MTVRIIDTHQHLWDRSRLTLPWLKDVPPLDRDFSPEDYRQMTSPLTKSESSGSVRNGDGGSGNNELSSHESSSHEFNDYEITESIYMEVDTVSENLMTEIDLVLDLIRQPENSTIGMVAATRPGELLFHELLEKAEGHPEIVGFRDVLHTPRTPAGHSLAGPYIADLKQLGQKDLTFDICIRREELSDAGKLIAQCPDTQFVLDHCGNADVRVDQDAMQKWRDDIHELSRHDNLVCKVSGFIWTIQQDDWSESRDLQPIVEHVTRCFGEDRLVFGGDWPVCTLSKVPFAKWIGFLHRFSNQVSATFSDKLFCRTAEKVYLKR